MGRGRWEEAMNGDVGEDDNYHHECATWGVKMSMNVNDQW